VFASSHFRAPPLLQWQCLPEILAHHAGHIPDATAILAPQRAPLTYQRLQNHVKDVGGALRALGIGRNDRVAVVLPDGPEMAVTFLSVAASATCAPLNPAYSAEEFVRYLVDLGAKALILQSELPSPARTVAHAIGLRVIELMPRIDAEAGLFMLTGNIHSPPAHHESAAPEDVALVLHTSGTTARPKIVPLTHSNICAAADSWRVALALTECDRCLDILPLFHVYGLIGTLFVSLTAGGSVICPQGFSVPSFFASMAEFSPTWYAAVPALHQAILMHASDYRDVIAHRPLRFIRSGGASLPPEVLTELEQVFKAPVLKGYGITEASGRITSDPLPPRQRKAASVGVPVDVEVASMSATGELLPTGVVGEIVVRGANVIQSYDNDPTEAREAFTDGWFRTGDQGFLDADGYLFITGRIKDVINRGGELVAPEEIDALLADHPAVAQAVTFAVPHARWGEEVVSAVVLRRNATASEQELRRFAATRLAAFKVPSQVLIVETIPTGPMGKLQRHSLAEAFGLQRIQQAPPTPHTAPLTPIEKVLIDLWTTVLGLDGIDIHDNFFQLGGDSLLATQLLSRIREVTHVEVSLRVFFETPTIAEVAKYIAAGQRATPPLPELPRPVPREHHLPLSYAQRRLWFLEQLGLSRHVYHLLEVLHLRGTLHVAALEQSFRSLIERHAALRTTYTSIAGQPFQVVGPTVLFPLSFVDWHDLPTGEWRQRIDKLAQAEVRQPFNLAQGPLIRATLVRLADEEHVLLLTMHHLVSDGWSHGVFWRELATLYGAFARGQPSTLPPLPVQYADFVHWQQQWLRGQGLPIQRTYWMQQLADLPTLQLPTDYQRPTVQTFHGARQALTLSPTLTQALKMLSQRHGVTLFMTLLAAFQTLLHRYTGQDDIVVGTLIAHRNRAEFEGLIGYFVNILVLRTKLAGDPSFRTVLARVRDVTLGAYEHQDLPYEKLLEELNPPRDLSRNPLFQVLCVLHNTPQQAWELPGTTVQSLDTDPGTARFDLTLELWETSTGLQGRLEYCTDLFEAMTIADMAAHFETLLKGIVVDPEQRLSQLPLLTADERRRLMVEWNSTTATYPDEQCIHSLFETQAARTPDTVALVCGDESLTYYALNRTANHVAHYLRGLGVGPETVVGLYVERSIAMVQGLLGILKAGAAYLPLDPAYPLERLAFMLDDARPPVILTQERFAAKLPSHKAQLVCLDSQWPTIIRYRGDNPGVRTFADQLAYLLYTSGSTGSPKGVLGLHRATLNALAWMWETFPFAPDDICCQKTSMSFGDSIQELLGPLLRGIRMVIVPDAITKNLPRFVQTLGIQGVTRLIVVPSLLRTLLDSYGDLAERLPSLKLWFAGGEALSSDLVERFRVGLPGRRLINLYGATEASDDTTWYDTSEVSHQLSRVPIGRPIANTQVYALDQHLQPTLIGTAGELYIGSDSLTRGYFHRPQLTAERFIPHPYSHEPGKRLYKSGDLVRYQRDGTIEYDGRHDQQVKLRGVLVEPEEIEAALRQHLAVREATVVAREDAPGSSRLVAYLVPTQEPGPTIGELRRFLEQKLPSAMIPATFVMLEGFPLTPSGKVDRLALPPPDRLRPPLEDLYVAPSSPVERQIAAIWCRLLSLEKVGIHDNFFELGGHSLLAMELLFRVQDALHVEVPLASFFERPTVAHMAAFIAAASQTEHSLQAPPIAPIRGEGALPASIAQEHFWFFDQLMPGLPLFNIPYVMHLQGRLEVSTLEHSVCEIIKRHESLRTTFTTVDGQLVQVILPAVDMPLVVRDLSALPEAQQAEEAQRLMWEESQRPFDLRRGPLLRICLLRLNERHHLLLMTLHHIISDGWSLGLLVRELAVAYDALGTGAPLPLPVLPIQYADLASWQRQWRQNAMLTSQMAYWRVQLHAPLPALELPTDRPRGTGWQIHVARQPLEVPNTVCETLKDLSQREGCTLFMSCLTAFKMLLYGYTAQEDVRVATLVANRTRRETEGMIGLCANTVILRTDLGGNPSGREVLQRVRATTLAAYACQDLPFEEVLQTLEHECNLQRASLCQVMLIWQNAMVQPQHCTAHTLSFLTIEQPLMMPDVPLTTFDIILTLRERPQGLSVLCLYKTDLFDAARISRLLDDFRDMLENLGSRPEQDLATLLNGSMGIATRAP
jgi:amino acid adenylation domain-containing protein